MALLFIPSSLQKMTKGLRQIQLKEKTVLSALQTLEIKFPGLTEPLMADTQALKSFVTVFVDGEDIRYLEGLNTPIHENSSVSLVVALAGG